MVIVRSCPGLELMLIVAIMLRIFCPKGACLSSKLTARVDRSFQFQKSSQFFIRTHNETLSIVAVCVNNEDCPGLYPVIRNSLVGLAPYLGKFPALNQIGEFHCHSFFFRIKPISFSLPLTPLSSSLVLTVY